MAYVNTWLARLIGVVMAAPVVWLMHRTGRALVISAVGTIVVLSVWDGVAWMWRTLVPAEPA